MSERAAGDGQGDRVGDGQGDAPVGATIYEVHQPGRRGAIGELPALVRTAVRMLYAADRTGVLLLAVFALTGGVLVGVEAFAARAAITGALAAYAERAGVAALAVPLAVLLVAQVVSTAVAALDDARRQLLTERATRRAERLLLDAATAASVADFDDPAFHDRLQRARSSMHQSMALVNGVVQTTSATVSVVAALVTLLAVQPLLALAVPLAAIPVVLVAMRSGNAYYAFAFAMTPAERERGYLMGALTERAGAKEVRAFGVAPWLRARHETLSAQRMDKLRAVVLVQLRAQLVSGLVTGLLVAGLALALLELTLTGRLAVADLAVALGLVTVIGRQVGGAGWAVGQLWESALFLRDVTALEQPHQPRPASAPPSANRVQQPGQVGQPGRVGQVGPLERLRVERLDFGYPGADAQHPALQAVDLEVGAGEVVALVGENGSGKTTLATLIAGFRAPDAGRILWNDVDCAGLDDAGRAALREQVTVLFQDFVRYELTAGRNIGLGHPSAVDDDDAVRTAAQLSGAHEVVQGLPQQYDTLLAPAFLGGVDLSGGQWQRVALGRALVRRASLVVLDEPTAALDPRAEHELFARIRSVFAGRAVLLVSHRFSTVREADRIYVLHEGRVVEQGTHADLMALAGRYAELYELQASSYR